MSSNGFGRDGRTKYRGVRLRSYGKWVAEFRRPDGQRLWLGTFISPEEAAVAYDQALVESRGSLHKLNFPHLFSPAREESNQMIQQRISLNTSAQSSSAEREASSPSPESCELIVIDEDHNEEQNFEDVQREEQNDMTEVDITVTETDAFREQGGDVGGDDFDLALRREMLTRGVYEEEYLMNQWRLVRDMAQAMVVTPPDRESFYPFSWPSSPHCRADDCLWTNSL